MKYRILSVLVTFCLAGAGTADEIADSDLWEPEEGRELIGSEAPSLSGLAWLNSEPLDIGDLRGKVVLIRFWLVGCPYCANTAPSLVELHDRYKDRGLVVIGIHHPKSLSTEDRATVIATAKKFGFEFPVAQDRDWKVIREYWLEGKDRSYTSSSFLIDKKGVIRFVHDGGEYYRSETDSGADRAYQTIERKINELLEE